MPHPPGDRLGLRPVQGEHLPGRGQAGAGERGPEPGDRQVVQAAELHQDAQAVKRK